jgi:glycerophosphoryl diester phosphodiesterase
MPERHVRPERIGHRGAPREFDENTLPSFLRAIERGAEGVELDVHTTSQGTVVVHHDPVVTDPAGSPAPIAQLTDAEVARCVLPMGGRVPTLAEVMDAIGDRATVYVEVKGEGVGEAAVVVALAHGRRYAFHSFDHAAILDLHAQWPRLAYGVLLGAGTPAPGSFVGRYPVRDLWPHWSLVDKSLVEAAHRASTRVLVWTVNDAAVAARLTVLGVDGLCTDDVRLLPHADA